MNSPMWNKFDTVAVLPFVGYAEKRWAALEAELARVGMPPEIVNVRWQTSTPSDGVLLRNTPHVRMLERGGFMNSLLAHYRAVRTAYFLGCRSILVLEDDVRFIRDVGKLADAIDALPTNADLALFDWVERGKWTPEGVDALENAPFVRTPWKRFTDLRSAACYALSRDGMEALLDLVDAAFCGNGKLRVTDQYWPHLVERGLNCYCAFPCVAVQGVANAATLSDMNNMWSRYSLHRIDRNDYAD